VNCSRETYVDLATEVDGPVVVRAAATLDVDVEPLQAYAALTGRTAAPSGDDPHPADEAPPYAFLLESAEKVASSDPDGAFAPARDDRHARYSFVGYRPEAVVTVDDDVTLEVFDDRYDPYLDVNGGDVVDRLREVLPDLPLRGFPDDARQHLEGGLVGFLAYDAVYDLWLDEVDLERPASRYPDAEFVLTTRTLAFDHAAGTVSLVNTPIVTDAADAAEQYDALAAEAERVDTLLAAADPVRTGGFRREGETAGDRADYEAAVDRAKEHVKAGDIYQGVISRRRELTGEVDPLGFYEALRAVNPSPYMYLLAHDDRTIVGASPETLVSVGGDTVTSNPIAGTCPRGTSPVEDRRLAGEMLADDKERAEHTMLVDLARNDVRRVSEPGSVRVQEFMNVLKYSHVQHIESTVTGTLAADADAFDAVRAAFPAGTLSGAPKIRAMEIIDDLESQPRGPYGGGVGYVSWQGDADFAIVIRSATIEDEGDTQRLTVQAGAGIVADSDPASEFDETESKMDGVLAAIERIEGTDPTPAAPTDATEEVSR
jgi:anthranilate synthase component 1